METHDLPKLPDVSTVPKQQELLPLPDISNIPIVSPETMELAQEVQKTFATLNIAEVFEQINKSLSDTAIQIIQSIGNTVHEYWSSTFKQLADHTTHLAKAIAEFHLPTLTDEEAEQLVESNKVWGRYGWTYIPSMPLAMFDTPPADIRSANKMAMQYCTTAEMTKVFEDLKKWKLNHKDLSSAIFCYKNKQYKACALLLCGLIDSKMIRVRSDEKRPTGERAVIGIRNTYDGSGEKVLAEAMFVYNLLSYLETLFANGHGFKAEPDTLNRNYIGHGMNHRTVRKRDCIQLFLALNNLLNFLDLER